MSIHYGMMFLVGEIKILREDWTMEITIIAVFVLASAAAVCFTYGIPVSVSGMSHDGFIAKVLGRFGFERRWVATWIIVPDRELRWLHHKSREYAWSQALE